MVKCSIGYDNGLFYSTAALRGSCLFDEMQPTFMELRQKIFLWSPKNDTEVDAKSQLLEMIKEL
jgi:hypothetical protein